MSNLILKPEHKPSLKLKTVILTLSLLCLFGLFSSPSTAAIEEAQFTDAALKSRYQSLIIELRCLVCQNQNIADSDAGLAKDLRRKTREMLIAGKTDDEIRAYMRERYGDFVLYDPPFEAKYWALWLLPFILLALVLVGLTRYLRTKQAQVDVAPNSVSMKARQKANDLLTNDPRGSD